MGYIPSGMDDLAGKKVMEVRMTPDREYLQFVCEGGDVLTYYAEGDCCSRSWIEHVSNIENLPGSVVQSVEDVEIIAQDDPEHDFLRVYSTKLILRGKAAVEIEYRNASNGYYGGSMQRVERDVDAPVLTEDF